MAKYRCECGKDIIIRNTSLKIVKGKVVSPEAYCETCKTYGRHIKEHDGFGGIISKKGGKVGGKI
jgi:hypothetical protein